MQVMTRVLALFAFILAALALPASADSADDLRRAMIEMRQGDYESALRTAGREGSIGRDVIEWHRLRAGRGTGGEVIAFLGRRPDWPGLDWLRRKSEGAIAATGQAEVLRFFTQSPPQSPEGVLAFANALIDTDARGDGEAAGKRDYRFVLGSFHQINPCLQKRHGHNPMCDRASDLMRLKLKGKPRIDHGSHGKTRIIKG